MPEDIRKSEAEYFNNYKYYKGAFGRCERTSDFLAP